MSKPREGSLTRRLPEPGELWVGIHGSAFGRVIRIEATDDSHVTYTVVQEGPVSPSRTGSGRISAGSLRTTYRPQEAT